MSSSYRLSLDAFLSELDVKADKVLDIGGAQLPVKGRTKSWDVESYDIADLDDPHVEMQRPDIVFDINKPVGSVMPDYDLIFCLEVF
jgi:hypothetical protein